MNDEERKLPGNRRHQMNNSKPQRSGIDASIGRWSKAVEGMNANGSSGKQTEHRKLLIGTIRERYSGSCTILPTPFRWALLMVSTRVHVEVHMPDCFWERGLGEEALYNKNKVKAWAWMHHNPPVDSWWARWCSTNCGRFSCSGDNGQSPYGVGLISIAILFG